MKIRKFSYWPSLDPRVDTAVDLEQEGSEYIDFKFTPSVTLLEMMEREATEAAAIIARRAFNA